MKRIRVFDNESASGVRIAANTEAAVSDSDAATLIQMGKAKLVEVVADEFAPEPEPEFKTKPGKRRGRPRKNKGDDA